MTTHKRYLEWLEATLNHTASACRDYARSAGESPPERLTEFYSVLQKAWDSYQIIINNDTRYKNPKIWEYKNANQTLTPEETYNQYLTQELPKRYSQKHLKPVLKKYSTN